MEDLERQKLIKASWEIHDAVERAYLEFKASKGDKAWLEKQRILLADMAVHLMQTALSSGEIDLEKLKNNIHSILTISDQFLPSANLKKATTKIYE